MTDSKSKKAATKEDLDNIKKKSVSKTAVKKKTSKKEVNEVERLTAEVAELKDRNMRQLADIDNMHKHHSAELTNYKNLGKKMVLVPIIEFMNTLNIGFNFTPETEDEKVLKYIETMKKSFAKAQNDMGPLGVELVVPQTGDDYDPETMQALGESINGENKVINVVNIGLKIDGKVSQPAVVMI